MLLTNLYGYYNLLVSNFIGKSTDNKENGKYMGVLFN